MDGLDSLWSDHTLQSGDTILRTWDPWETAKINPQIQAPFPLQKDLKWLSKSLKNKFSGDLFPYKCYIFKLQGDQLVTWFFGTRSLGGTKTDIIRHGCQYKMIWTVVFFNFQLTSIQKLELNVIPD